MAYNQLSADEVIVGDIKTIVPGMVQKAMYGTVARTNTSGNRAVIGVLPAGAAVIGVAVQGATASNAGTTATVSIGYSTFTEILNAESVLSSGHGVGQYIATNATLGVLSTSKQTIQATYAETGTASSAGGPWVVVVEFVTV